MISNRQIIGSLIMIFAIIIILLTLPLFSGVITGLMIFVFGLIIFLNKKEDEIEKVKYSKLNKSKRK